MKSVVQAGGEAGIVGGGTAPDHKTDVRSKDPVLLQDAVALRQRGDEVEYPIQPIGIIHTPFTEQESTPIQPSRSEAVGRVEVYPDFVAGLQDIEGFSHIILLYVFHCSSGYTLSVKPFLDDQQRGLFATRYPSRPNPIGLSVVRLLRRDNNELFVKQIDVLDGTPLVDIRPYVPDFDVRTGVSTGWYATRANRD